jgi:hypothetical protein
MRWVDAWTERVSKGCWDEGLGEIAGRGTVVDGQTRALTMAEEKLDLGFSGRFAKLSRRHN